MKLDESCYFCFNVNEINSKGLEKDKFTELKQKEKNIIDFKIKGVNKNIKLKKMNISLIQFPKNSIQEIINFYNRILEFSFLFPIYYNKDLNPNFDSNEGILKKNFFILNNIFKEISSVNNYYQNFFFNEINEFMFYFNQLLPSIGIQKKVEKRKIIQKPQINDKKDNTIKNSLIDEEEEEEDSYTTSEENIENSFIRNKLKNAINSEQNENKYYKKFYKLKLKPKVNFDIQENNKNNNQVNIKNNGNKISDFIENKKNENIIIKMNAKNNQNNKNYIENIKNKNDIINSQINQNIFQNQINNIPNNNQIKNNIVKDYSNINNNNNNNNNQINNIISNKNMNINIKDNNNNKKSIIQNEDQKDSNDDENNQIIKEMNKDIIKENKEKNNLQDNFKDIDLVNNQNFNFEKDIWSINKDIENPQLRNNNFKDLLDTSQFEKKDKNKKNEESLEAYTKNELKEIMINQIIEKNKSYYIKRLNKIVIENDDEEKNRIFEDDTGISKRVFDFEEFNNNINNINNNSFNPNIFNNNIISNKKEKNIFIDFNFINKIKNFRNNKDSSLEKDNNNFFSNTKNIFNPEDISDIKHDFEKDIKYENKKTINEKDDNDLKQYIRYRNSITINYNPEIQTVLKKNFDKKDKKNNLLDLNIPFENEDLFNPLDETLLNKIIENINKEDIDNDNYKLSNLKPPIEPKNLYKDNNSNDEYLINKLIQFSKSYIISFFELFSKTKIDFSNIAFCFILDCSLYLGIERKLDYLIYILSMLKIIQMLNIKFCIFLTADDNYKVLIKKYEEIINYEDLIERIYEAYIIKRFRNNLLKSVQIAIESLKCSDRENIIFLVFSDSLDESIIKYNYWKSNILINKNNSFIFFISNHYIRSKQDIINNMWDKFEKANKNSNSKIKIIKSLKKENVFKNIEEFLNKLQIKENNNKIIQPRIEPKKLIIKHFDEILNCVDFKEFDQIFFSTILN